MLKLWRRKGATYVPFDEFSSLRKVLTLPDKEDVDAFMSPIWGVGSPFRTDAAIFKFWTSILILLET